ncbi:MAG: TRAP transporter small permease, partial [Acidobacteria bacterium]
FPEEVSRYCYVWITFLGLSLATKTGEHIRVTLAVERLPAGLRRPVVAGVELLSAVTLLGLAVLGFRFMDFTRMSISPALEIPMNVVYAAFPVGCLLAVVRLARALVAVLRGAR